MEEVDSESLIVDKQARWFRLKYRATFVACIVAFILVMWLLLYGTIGKGREAAPREDMRRANINTLASNLLGYKNQNHRYPANLNKLINEGWLVDLPADPSAYQYYYEISPDGLAVIVYVLSEDTYVCGRGCYAAKYFAGGREDEKKVWCWQSKTNQVLWIYDHQCTL